MRRNKLDAFDDNWAKRPLFRKRRRFRVLGWLFSVTLVCGALFLAWNEIPDLLLDGFKLIAQLAPDPASERHTAIH